MSTAKPPVAIRITRPYQTEDEFLSRELETISRTGVTLVGAQPRPEGVVVRFELTLAEGTPLLRGEGRVIAYKANALGSEPGLALRFTRLDSKSKALVDRVSQRQTERRRSLPPPPPSVPPSVPVPPAPPPSPMASADIIPISVELPAESNPELEAKPPEPESKPALVQATDRNGTLERLRNRASALAQPDVERILTDGAARRASRRA